MEKPQKITTATKTAKKNKTAKIDKQKFPISNPDRILYPEEGITKIQLAEYYDSIQDWILPHLIKRPLTLVRCPSGRMADCFFQKHFPEDIAGLYPISIKEKHATRLYSYLKNVDGLISLVQLGVLEIHAWGCHIDNVEKPDVIIFDLDPGPNVEWKDVVRAAFLLKDELEKLNLQSFVKTTGGKGLHIALPIQRKYSWEQVRLFAELLVKHLVATHPDKYVGTMTKAKRPGKIFIDYFRNNRGATAVVAYSTRAREGAPVSTPLYWNELGNKIKANTFNITNIGKRLAKLESDPWEDFFTLKQSLTFRK